MAAYAAEPGIATNPLSEPLVKGNIRVQVVDFLQMPKTHDMLPPTSPAAGDKRKLPTNNAYARLQYMMPIPDDSGRLVISDLRGILYITDTAATTPVVLLDLREATSDFTNQVFPNETGLLGFAFHPEFSAKDRPGYGRFYTAYSVPSDSGAATFANDQAASHKSVVREWSMTNHAAQTFSGSSREVLRVGQFDAAHNIGTLAFNPAARPGSMDFGALYICLGDGGSAFDPMGNGQNLKSPLGALLRINPLAKGSRAYTIPADNPFVGTVDALDEIWAFGLRHAQHFSFARDGRLFINDIGQNQIEEVNLGRAGANYGWNLREGTFALGHSLGPDYSPLLLYPIQQLDDGLTYPIAQYDHDDGTNAIGSGFLYEGSEIPQLKNMYVAADLVRGRLFYFDPSSDTSKKPAALLELRVSIDGTEQPLVDVLGYANTYAPSLPRVDLRLGIDAQGELYVLTKGDGRIRKLVAL